LSFRSPADHFNDILYAIALIQEFVGTSTLEVYRHDLKTKSSVERQFQILSEAACRLGAEAETSAPGLTGWACAEWATYFVTPITAPTMMRSGKPSP
jgi:uncharacterized protein with HEPN domain